MRTDLYCEAHGCSCMTWENNCKTCWFFGALEGTEAGYCHRHPPAASTDTSYAYLDGVQVVRGRWPIVEPHEWCGEWRGWQDAEANRPKDELPVGEAR